MNSKATLKDVARLANVSYQTVSKVLRNQIAVTPETYQRIQDAVDALGYRPNSAARSLRTQATYLIGYSFKPHLEAEPSPILEQFLMSISHTAETYDYHIMLFPWRSEEYNAPAYKELITANRVDGFILSDIDFDDPRIPLLQAEKFPFVPFGCMEDSPDYSYVEVDGEAGIRMAVEHLIEHGHHRIAVLAWPEESRVGESRLHGYYTAMQAANLPIRDEWLVRGIGTVDVARRNMTKLLDLPESLRPTAVVTMVDLMALGAMHAIQARGCRVGKDIAVTGFDDTPLARYVEPAITTVRQPVQKVGQLTVDLLMDQIGKKNPDPQQHMVTPELIIRKSSLP
jgi:DNA-binding LacI/PurR family transcriptional regulator